MDILYLTKQFPYPLTSGYLRHYFLIRELSRRHRVTLLSIVGNDFTPEHVQALTPLTRRVLTFATARNSGALSRARRLLRRVTESDPAISHMRAAIQQLMREERFDAVLCGKHTYPALKRLNGPPIVVDLCDATSVRLRHQMRHVGLARRLLRLPRLLYEQRVEGALPRVAAHVLFASCRDRAAVLGSDCRRATVVPNGVDLAFWKRSSAERGANAIVFTGAMNYAPNTDAALYLVEQIMPLVQRAVPEAHLYLVGRDPTPRLLSAGSRPGVTVTGFVEDVRPYLDRATVFAAPLRFGAGIQNKVLEAMAMEVPVVASPLAADGLRTEEGESPPLQIAQSPEQFAQLIVGQLIARTHNAAPDPQARRFVQRHFDWGRSAEKIERVLSRVTRGEG